MFINSYPFCVFPKRFSRNLSYHLNISGDVIHKFLKNFIYTATKNKNVYPPLFFTPKGWWCTHSVFGGNNVKFIPLFWSWLIAQESLAFFPVFFIFSLSKWCDWVKNSWHGSGQFFVAWVGLGQLSCLWAWVWKISPKNPKYFNFSPFGLGQRPLFYCESKVCLGRVGLRAISTKCIPMWSSEEKATS